MLKRCKSTYLRQATRLQNLTKSDIMNLKHENLNRFNHSFEVFKNMRGTSMYYQESKKNLMALLRQNGCPTLFFTLSCAEFDWTDLLKEIIELKFAANIYFQSKLLKFKFVIEILSVNRVLENPSVVMMCILDKVIPNHQSC